jgi:hypothetical protein
MASRYTRGSVTTLHDRGGVLGLAFGHFLWSSHSFMVTTLGSCVEWPLSVIDPSVAKSNLLHMVCSFDFFLYSFEAYVP